MIKTLVFDIGNVLVNWYPEKYVKQLVSDGEAVKDIVARVFECPEWKKGDIGEYSREDTRRALLERYPQDAEIIEKALDGADGILTASAENTALLKRLRAAGFELYYLSNTNPSAFEYMTATHEFFNYLDGGIASYKVGLLKPSEEIFELFLRTFGKSAEECVFVDDTPVNTAAAARCGFGTVTLKSLSELESELMKFDDVANAMKGK